MIRPRLFGIALTLAAASATGQSPAPAPTIALIEAADAPAPPLDRAASAVGAMQRTLDTARARLESAQADKDLVEVNCVAGKLAAIKGLLGVARDAQQSLGEALARADAELSAHQARKIELARARVESLAVQVDGCAGEAAAFTGDATIELQVDPTLRTDDPSRAEPDPIFTAVNTARPPALSGSQ